MSEEWRLIADYAGYEVSNLGRVRSWRPRNRHHPLTEPKLLKPQPNSKGYLTVKLHDGAGYRVTTVHKLVMGAFVGPRPSGLSVCHGNGNQLDNRLTNLRYGTPKSNSEDAIRHGTMKHGEGHYEAKLTEVTVREARKLYAAGGISQAQLGARFGVSLMTMNSALRRRTWKHVA